MAAGLNPTPPRRRRRSPLLFKTGATLLIACLAVALPGAAGCSGGGSGLPDFTSTKGLPAGCAPGLDER